ncbi:MAG: hypothetical protein HYX47_08490 [Burkholderiales bacterium]|nr:hypothetical protein [Burkholderiales bacterium]
MSTTPAFAPASNLVFVTSVSRLDVLAARLCESPCVKTGGCPLVAYHNVRSAADAFNAARKGLSQQRPGTWLVWVHQDVYLPEGWDAKFLAALQQAQSRMPALAVAGVYGVAGSGAGFTRAGHVLDRGNLLREAPPLPQEVDSLDELLFAVSADSELTLDPAMGFDFYGTDVVLQAQAAGLQAAVVDAYCEHWSDTPSGPEIPATMAQRIVRNGRAFEAKWAHRFPVQTSWLRLEQTGDVERFISSLRAGTA